jgi:hypothetical protein
MTDTVQAPAPKRGGWPKGKARGKPLQHPLNEPLQAPTLGHNSRVIAYGHNGEELTRKRTISSDIFDIPSSIIPQGWDYQWNVLEVVGQPQTAMRLAMAENGWRPVPAGRHPGLFMPADYPPGSPIIRDGLQLEERPMILTEEARAEEKAKASKQVRDQLEQLRLTKDLPPSFTRDNSRLQAMERQGTSRSYAPAPDAPRPALPIDPA